MAAWSCLPESIAGATCQQVVHPWTKSCTLATLDLALASCKGASLFYLIFFTFEHLRKRVKQRDFSKVEQNSIGEICKTFTKSVRSVVLFGCLEASSALMSLCTLRYLIGEFRRPTMIWIPGVIGGLAIFNQDYKARVFYSSVFTNSVMSLFTRRLKTAGGFELSLAVKTGVFMALSSTISGLLKALVEEAPHYQFFWFFNPTAHCSEVAEERQREKQCYHSNPCQEHILNDFLKYFTSGLLLTIIRTFAKHGQRFWRNPKHLIKLTQRETFKLGTFMGLYALIYQGTRCCLHHLEGQSRVVHDAVAGGLAGVTFVFQPSSSIFNFAVITFTQILTRYGCRRGWIPDWPFAEITYAICNGFLFDAAVFVNDCPRLTEYIIKTSTDGRMEYYRENLQKLLRGTA